MKPTQVTFSVDMKDIQFGLFEILKIQELFHLERFQHLQRDDVAAVLGQAERMAVDVVHPVNKVADLTPPRFEEGKVSMPKAFHRAFKIYGEAGWIPITLEKAAGGMGLPEVVGMALKDMFNGACGGFYAFSGLTLAALNLINAYGDDHLKRQYADKMAKGVYTGTMCLTEPEAGSYLADITTRAVRDGDGYRIEGTKIFIGTGDHDLSENIIHCVLARIEDAPEGYAGISLFAVPKYHVNDDGTLGAANNVRCGGIERKMGWDGAPTAILHFGEQGECRGRLLGAEGKGLAQMFQMMNEMRLGTAAQGVGQAAAAYRMTLSYARTRRQGLSYRRKKGDPLIQVPIIEHPDIRRNLLFMKTIVEGCRLLVLQTALYIDLSKALQDESHREYYEDLVEILTPVCKAYATDMGFRAAETAVQTLGGYGYIRDYPVEQYLRDIKVACIYEGTNGIHGIDLQRRKLTIKDGRLFRSLLRELDEFIRDNVSHPALGSSVTALAGARDKMESAAAGFPQKGEEDPGLPLTVAKPFLDLTGHVLCTWMLLKGATAAHAMLEASGTTETDRAFYRGKISTARFAVTNLLPRVDALAATIAAWDRSILDMAEDEF